MNPYDEFDEALERTFNKMNEDNAMWLHNINCVGDIMILVYAIILFFFPFNNVIGYFHYLLLLVSF